MSVCYVSAFYDINRENWKALYPRSFSEYLKYFLPYIDLFSRDDKKCEMIVYIDDKHIDEVKKHMKPNTDIKLIPINKEFMETNIPMWKKLDREKEIMSSSEFKNLIPHRLNFPENSVPEYSLINHSKIDFVNYTIENKLSSFDYFLWTDFGVLTKEEFIPKKFINIDQMKVDKINISLINHMDNRDSDRIYILINAPEKIGGAFYFGEKNVWKKFQCLYHAILSEYQISGICDDDQALVIACHFRDPTLFHMHYIGRWSITLRHFSE